MLIVSKKLGIKYDGLLYIRLKLGMDKFNTFLEACGALDKQQQNVTPLEL